MLLPNVMVVYKVLRNADCSSNATTRPCCFTRWLVFVQILRPFNCWGQVPLNCMKWEYSCQGHIWRSWLPWRFPWKTPLETFPQILYPNASTNVGLWCLSWVFHCLDKGCPPLTMSELNFTWNFVLMLWTILHCFTSHLYCHACWGTGTFLIAQSAIKWF